MLPISKMIITDPPSELEAAFGINEVRSIPAEGMFPDGTRNLSMEQKTFNDSGRYGGNTILQRCQLVRDMVTGNILVTTFWDPLRSGEYITTVGSWRDGHRRLLGNKLPHIIADPNGIGNFGILTDCETDDESRILFFGRVLNAQSIGVFTRTDGDNRKTLLWKTPEELDISGRLNPAQRAALVWYMKQDFCQ